MGAILKGLIKHAPTRGTSNVGFVLTLSTVYSLGSSLTVSFRLDERADSRAPSGTVGLGIIVPKYNRSAKANVGFVI